MFVNAIGDTSATRKLNSQFDAADMAVTRDRIASGAISDAYMNGIKNRQMGNVASARK